MKPVEITDNVQYPGLGIINYMIEEYNKNSITIVVQKEVVWQILNLFFETDEEKIIKDLKLNFFVVFDLFNVGKVKLSEYAKFIIDACMNDVITEPIAAIALNGLLYHNQDPLLKIYDVLTLRLVGKKRIEFYKEHLGKYKVRIDDSPM